MKTSENPCSTQRRSQFHSGSPGILTFDIQIRRSSSHHESRQTARLTPTTRARSPPEVRARFCERDSLRVRWLGATARQARNEALLVTPLQPGVTAEARRREVLHGTFRGCRGGPWMIEAHWWL